MTEAVIIFAVLLILASTILATIYRIVRDAPSQPQNDKSYRRHRPWNFK
jgi:hypothetical protein